MPTPESQPLEVSYRYHVACSSLPRSTCRQIIGQIEGQKILNVCCIENIVHKKCICPYMEGFHFIMHQKQIIQSA